MVQVILSDFLASQVLGGLFAVGSASRRLLGAFGGFGIKAVDCRLIFS